MGAASRIRLLTIAALVSIGLCGLPSRARADQVVLKNGDKVTGKITSVSKRELIVETDLAGRTTIAWKAVSTVTTTTGFRATLANGQAVEGTAVVSDGRVSIRQANGALTPVDLDALRTLALASETPGARAWHAALIAGLDLSRGNSETLTMATNGVATLLGSRDRLGLFGTALFSSIGSGASEVTTARTERGGVRYDHDLIGVMYGFGFADAENDPLQLLDLRTVVGSGLGAHAYKTDTTQFNVFAGVSYANDSYSQAITTTTPTTPPPTTPTTPGQGGTPPGQGGTAPGQAIKPTRSGTPPPVVNTTLSRSVAEALAGQDLYHQLTDNLSLFEGLTFFTAMSNTSDNRIAFDVSLSAQLNGWLQWNLSAADRYLNIPPSGGAVQNDLYVSTGLGITFGRGANGAYRGAAGPPVRK
jgi:putative salt-induced outer membrane protein YdiY